MGKRKGMKMKETLKRLYQKYESFILYALYGIPTTVINFGGYAFLMDVCGLDAAVSSFIAWIAAMLASFSLYRRYVFKRPPAPIGQKFQELVKFAGVRAGTGLFETGFVWLFVSYWGLHAYLFKILASGLSVLINYMVSKFCIFRHEKQVAES